MPKKIPSTEAVISGGTVLAAGQLFVVKDTNKVVVNPVQQTAAALIASIGGGATTLTTINVVARIDAYPDTGAPIFEV